MLESPFYAIISFVFTFDFKKVFMHIFVEHHLLDISDALATNTQNFSRNVATERQREISRRRREIYVLSERTPGQALIVCLRILLRRYRLSFQRSVPPPGLPFFASDICGFLH